MHDDIEQILISGDQLRARTVELARDITAYYQGRSLLLVGILKGAVMFLVDLARALDLPVEIDFMAISSYGNSTESSGVVRILKDLDEPIENKDVLIVEDIIDSGLTLQYLLDILQKRHPLSLRVCALLDKEKPRAKVLDPQYVGFHIPDRFVVGYGLDYAQIYRNLPYIGVLKESVYTLPESSQARELE
ncbi:MAG TPA: hypoxanthine phosphoribosyltransferase [Ktedonobacterales bacterium]|nr:hypoxanthine phosphoribosyltransferase [Ktedonobacterales bacterium]